MYTPRAFAEHDLRELDRLLARDSFVTLITCAEGEPFVSHLPVLYSRTGDQIVIEGHWAKPNPQARHQGTATLIVHGPHAYISPGWYPDKETASRVPTWNYAVAHLSGAMEASDDEAFLASIVDRLSVRHEAVVGSDWRYEHERESHRSQLRGIIGFRFVPQRIELKFKVSQNHPPANVRSAAAQLMQQPNSDSHDIAALMLDRLTRRPND